MDPQRTPLYEEHCKVRATLVDFAGWSLPIHYGSQLQEHHAVRNEAGVFDVSHMTVIDLKGENARSFLRYLLANDVAKLPLKKALYGCMLNESGGIIDDLIVYYLRESPDYYRMVVNAATREKDIVWIKKQAEPFNIDIEVCQDIAMIALQGPLALSKLASVLSPACMNAVSSLHRFEACTEGHWFIARTGYTGEDGVEIILPAKEAPLLWQQLLNNGVKPCGLGARDTLRLEAGMHLYGSDMDENVTPLESGLGWTVSFEDSDRNFIGKAALLQQKAEGVKHRFVGLILEAKGVLRNHQRIVCANAEDGEITSGSFSPTLQQAIAMARIPASAKENHCQIDMRGRLLPARIVNLPFVRKSKESI